MPECSAVPVSMGSSGSVSRQQVIYTSLGRSIQLHVVHPDVTDPLTSLSDPLVSPLTHVLLHYQGIEVGLSTSFYILIDFTVIINTQCGY